MNMAIRRSKRTAISAVLASLVCLAPAVATAEQVTLRSNGDTAFEVTGEFISFENDVYTIETESLGRINVRGDSVTCIGTPCQTISNGAQSGPIVWDVSLWGSRRAFTEHVEKLAELVAEKTDGQFTLNLSYGGLAPSRENLDGIAAGSFQMAQICAGYHPEKNPAINVLELPFLGVASMEQERVVSQAIYNHPAVIDDMARWNATILMPTPQPQYNIAGVGEPPTSIAAFQNMTVRATGGTGDAIRALGAQAVTIPAPQVRDALSNGEVNAVAFAPHAHMAFNTIDSAIWWTTNLNPGTANCPVIVNTDALNALPTASRVALLSSTEDAVDHFIANYEATTMAAWDEALLERGIIELTINDSILSAINAEVAGPAASAWIAQTTALGLPGRELYNLLSETLEATR